MAARFNISEASLRRNMFEQTGAPPLYFPASFSFFLYASGRAAHMFELTGAPPDPTSAQSTYLLATCWSRPAPPLFVSLFVGSGRAERGWGGTHAPADRSHPTSEQPPSAPLHVRADRCASRPVSGWGARALNPTPKPRRNLPRADHPKPSTLHPKPYSPTPDAGGMPPERISRKHTP